MPDIPARQDCFVAKSVCHPVAKLTRAQYFHPHSVRMDGHQLHDLTAGVGDDLAIRVAAQRQMALQHLPPLERVLVPVGPAAKQGVKPVIGDPVFSSIDPLSVEHDGKRCHRLGQDTHAGINRRESKRCIRGDANATGCPGRYGLKPEVPPSRAVIAGRPESVEEAEKSH